MIQTGTTYDQVTNVMSVGVIDACFTTNPPGNSSTHSHFAQLIIENVEDLIGWSARFNYLGDKMRIANVDATPFRDLNTDQLVGFANLPTDGVTGLHRDVATSSSIPAAPPDNTNTPQTASVGASYLGLQTFAISPNTPHTPSPGDDSYAAVTGGVLGTLQLQVVGNEQGNQLFMNLDDGSPNSPGSSFSYFDGAGLVESPLSSGALADGFHGEGVTCTPQDCTNPECPATPTPSATPADADGDGVPNATDNCPSWPNPGQNLPPWTVGLDDPDCDGFNTTVEDPSRDQSEPPLWRERLAGRHQQRYVLGYLGRRLTDRSVRELCPSRAGALQHRARPARRLRGHHRRRPNGRVIWPKL